MPVSAFFEIEIALKALSFGLIMGLKVGEKAPDFCLASTAGGELSLGALKGQAFILYFYPKDFTSLCTQEACSFRDNFEHLRDLSIPAYGVSKDDLDTHHRFKSEHALPFDLLADVDGAVARSYKARVPLLGVTKRITYLIDADLKIAAVHDEMLGGASHVDAMLKTLRA